MEAVIAVVLMIIVSELRELRWSNRFRQMEDAFQLESSLQNSRFDLVRSDLIARKEAFEQVAEDVRNLRVTVESLRTDQSHLMKEYELRMRLGNLEEGQAIDGVIGL